MQQGGDLFSDSVMLSSDMLRNCPAVCFIGTATYYSKVIVSACSKEALQYHYQSLFLKTFVISSHSTALNTYCNLSVCCEKMINWADGIEEIISKKSKKNLRLVELFVFG